MGVSSLDFLGNFEGGCNPNGPLGLVGLDLGAQSRRRRQGNETIYQEEERSRRFLKRAQKCGFEKKVRAEVSSWALMGFSERQRITFLALQRRVKVMQMMVKVLSSGSKFSDKN